VKDVKNVYWWTSVSPDLIAKTLTENGRAIFDCDHCDRTLTIIDPLHE
jgi:hypothetical protein